MEDFDASGCVLGTGVEGSDRGKGPLSSASHNRHPFYASFPALLIRFLWFLPCSPCLH